LVARRIADSAGLGLGSGQHPNKGLEGDEEIRLVNFFWIVSAAMVLLGVALILGSLAAGLGPIALVCGVLLLWSGIVKVIVLRIWRATIATHDSTNTMRLDGRTKTRLGKL
jgi:hypothetical protein